MRRSGGHVDFWDDIRLLVRFSSAITSATRDYHDINHRNDSLFQAQVSDLFMVIDCRCTDTCINTAILCSRDQMSGTKLSARNKPVCVQPRPSAVNMTLPALTAEHRDCYQSISHVRGALSCCYRLTGQTGGREEAQPFYRPRSAYYAGSVNKRRMCLL